jgi:hypothetical protein
VTARVEADVEPVIRPVVVPPLVVNDITVEPLAETEPFAELPVPGRIEIAPITVEPLDQVRPVGNSEDGSPGQALTAARHSNAGVDRAPRARAQRRAVTVGFIAGSRRGIRGTAPATRHS